MARRVSWSEQQLDRSVAEEVVIAVDEDEGAVLDEAALSAQYAAIDYTVPHQTGVAERSIGGE